MGYKPITNAGKSFIENACKANSNNFQGSKKYPLGRSAVPVGTSFTANAKYKGVLIKDSTALANAIYNWYNKYAEMYLLDANILAAQGFAESNYNLWVYSNGGSANYSSAMGISQFIDIAIFELFVNRPFANDAEDGDVDLNEASIIFNGLNGDTTNIRNVIPYLKGSTDDTNSLAISNRKQLFQNVIDNPEIMIKAQCRLMHEIGTRNANLASSSLFAYNVGTSLSSRTYNEIITTAKNNKLTTDDGVKYVDRIFKILGGSGTTASYGKFYSINFNADDVANKNLSNTLLITGYNGLTTDQEKFIQSLNPAVQDKFRLLIKNIEAQTPYKIVLASSYRSIARQAELKAEYAITNPSVPVAPPGRSYHQFGLALDLSIYNPRYPNDVYGHNKTKAQWENTNVPQIAKSLGFVWGGDFTSYDPVHFDLSNDYALSALYKSAVNQFGSDPNEIQGNKISPLLPSKGGYA